MNNDFNGALGLIAGFGFFALVLILFFVFAFFAIYLVASYKLFKKNGKNGWEAFIPFYNTWVLVEIAHLSQLWFIIAILNSIISLLGLSSLSFVGKIAGIIANICIFYNLAKKSYQNVTLYAILGALLPGIATIMLGFNSSEFDEDVVLCENGIFGSNNNKSTSSKNNYCTKCGNRVNDSNYCEKCGSKIE